MSDEQANVKIGADTSELGPKMKEAAETVKNSLEIMKGDFAALGKTLEGFGGIFIGVAALLAGGLMLGESIKETMELSDSVRSLAMKMGITREEASTLKVALDHIGVSTEAYIGITTKLDRQLRNNEESLQAMGIKTREANGEYLNQKDLLTNALGAMMQYKEGTDRNLASMAMFGRGSDQVTKMLRMNDEIMREATETARAFGLVMGEDLEEQTFKLRMGMATVKTAVEAVEVAVAKAVMPAIVEMSEFIRGNATPIMEGFAEVFNVVVDAVSAVVEIIGELWSVVKTVFSAIGDIAHEIFGISIPGNLNIFTLVLETIRVMVVGFKLAVMLAFEQIKFTVDQLTGAVVTLIAAWRGLQHFDLHEAVEALAKGQKEAEDRSRIHYKKMVDMAIEANDKIAGIVGHDDSNYGHEGAGHKDMKGGGSKKYVDPKAGNDPDKERFTAKLALEKAMLEASLAQTKDNLTRAGALYDDAYKKNLITAKEYFAAKLQIDTALADKEIETKRAEAAAMEAMEAKAVAGAKKAKKNPEEDKQVLTIRTQLVKTTSDLAIMEAHRAELAINSNTKLIQAEREAADKLATIKIASTKTIGEGELAAQKMINDQKLEMGQITDIQLADLDKGLEEKKFQIEYDAIQKRIGLELGGNRDPAAVAALNAELEALHQQHSNAMLGIDIARDKAANLSWLTIQQTMTSSFSSSVNGLIMGTMTLQKAMANIFRSLGATIIDELVTKVIAKKLSMWATEKMINAGIITGEAAKGGAAGTASFAQAPWPIDLGAPAFGAGIAANIMAYVPAAKQGFDIPAGMNPMTQLHEKEMVLPSEQADVIRSMAGAGAGTIQINTQGGDFIHKNDLAKLLKTMGRNYTMGSMR